VEEVKPEQAKNGKFLYTEEIANKIVSACGQGFTMEKAAELVGIGLSTLHAWVKKRPELANRIKIARKEHELSLLRSIEQAGEKSWQAKAWLAERIYNHAQPSARLQVSGNVEHGMSNNLAQLLAGVASRRKEKQAQVIECQEVKALPQPKSKYNTYCATDERQPIVTTTLLGNGNKENFARKAKHKAMRRRKPRAESLAKYPPTTTPLLASPPPVSHA
jgi:hypothetical protein